MASLTDDNEHKLETLFKNNLLQDQTELGLEEFKKIVLTKNVSGGFKN